MQRLNEDCTQGEREKALPPWHGSRASVLALSQLAAEVVAVARGMPTDRCHCMAYTRSTASLRQQSGFEMALKCLDSGCSYRAEGLSFLFVFLKAW